MVRIIDFVLGSRPLLCFLLHKLLFSFICVSRRKQRLLMLFIKIFISLRHAISLTTEIKVRGKMFFLSLNTSKKWFDTKFKLVSFNLSILHP